MKKAQLARAVAGEIVSNGDRVLIVATTNVDESVLRDHVRGSEVQVVAPAAQLSPLEWLTSDEDGARAEAESVAEQSADAAASNGAAVEAETGDVDPLLAAEDALRQFPADRIVVVVRPEDEASWIERDATAKGFEQLGLPVTYLVG